MFIGTAGCCKTSLTNAFGRWLEQNAEAKVRYVNLDPGCMFTPYRADFDIREIFTVEKLMREEGLGPNGAMVRASEMIEVNAEDISEKIHEADADFTLIDTPGQMEIFVFRSAGPRIAEALMSRATTIAVYIMDPALAAVPSGLTVALSLSIATQLRLGTPVISVLNKADQATPAVDELLVNFDRLKLEVVREKSGAMVDLALRYVDAVRELSKASRLVKVSAKTGLGLEALYDMLRESLCVCGDLT
jgi:hypothetical protein